MRQKLEYETFDIEHTVNRPCINYFSDFGRFDVRVISDSATVDINKEMNKDY